MHLHFHIKFVKKSLLTIERMSRRPLATKRSRQATTRYDQARRCSTPGIRRLSHDTAMWIGGTHERVNKNYIHTFGNYVDEFGVLSILRDWANLAKHVLYMEISQT